MAQKKGYKMPDEHKRLISQANKGRRKSIADNDITACKMVYANYKSRAKYRTSVEFKLTLEQFRNMTKKDCYYCGTEPRHIQVYYRGQSYVYNGIDRQDNSIGYIEGNCVPCCRQCNVAKNNFTFLEFTAWVEKVYKHFYEDD